MGYGGWSLHASRRNRFRGPGTFRPRRERNLRLPIASGLLALLLLSAGAVAVAQDPPVRSVPPGKVGICHATGSPTHPYVFMVVDENGPAHLRHARQALDLVGVAHPSECPALPASARTTHAGAEEPGCPFAEDPVPIEEAEPAAPPPEAAPAGEGETEAPCAADVALQQTGTLDGSRLVFNFVVTSAGPDEANDVRLASQLPDVGRPWTLAGPDAADCQLAQRAVGCAFGDLLPQEIRTVSAWAARCPQDCGEDVSNEATVTAVNDADATNNVATATVEIPDCAAEPSPAQPSPSEPDPQPPAGFQPPTGDGPNGTDPEPPADAPPPDNETANGTEPEAPADDPAPDNDTANGTEPEPAPAPPPAGDVRVRLRSAQDDTAVVFTLTLTNAGPGNATNVNAWDDLPGVRRPWFLGGADASDCTLEAERLSCWFGELGPGGSRTVILMAYTDRLACGHHLTNTARGAADDDANTANNASSASIEAAPC